MSLVAAALGKPVNGKIITPQAAFPNCRHLHSGLSGSEEDLLGINSWAEKARGLQSALLLSRGSSGAFMFESVEQGAVGTFHFLQLCSPVTLQTRGLGFPKACVPGFPRERPLLRGVPGVNTKTLFHFSDNLMLLHSDTWLT